MGAVRRLLMVAVAAALASAGAPVGSAAVANQPQANQPQANEGAARLAVGKLPSASKNTDRCQQPEEDNGPDLCAQWAAANAAREANRINRTALLWNIAGFFALLLTLIATAWAAWAASTAARAAQGSVEQFQSAEAGSLVPKLEVLGQDRAQKCGPYRRNGNAC